MAWPPPVTLRASRATLEPLAHKHRDDLIEAVKDGELWGLWYTTIPEPEKMGAEIDRRLALQEKGSMLPFAVIDNTSGKAVGMTTYMNIDAPPSAASRSARPGTAGACSAPRSTRSAS